MEELTYEKFLDLYDLGERIFEDYIDQICYGAFGYVVDRIAYGENRRRSRWVEVVFKVPDGDHDRYFMVGYDEGLTEYQDNNYDNSKVHEVKPLKRTFVYTHWEKI